MVSPVNGGIPQQIPAANTFQPGGGSESVRRAEEEKIPDSTKPATSDAARAAPPETKTTGRSDVSFSERSEDTGRVSASTSRGTELDITV